MHNRRCLQQLVSRRKKNMNTKSTFDEMPLPWRYDKKTMNVIAADGAIVCRNGDGVYGNPNVGEWIVNAANANLPRHCSDCRHYVIGDHEWCSLHQRYPIETCGQYQRRVAEPANGGDQQQPPPPRP